MFLTILWGGIQDLGKTRKRLWRICLLKIYFDFSLFFSLTIGLEELSSLLSLPVLLSMPSLHSFPPRKGEELLSLIRAWGDHWTMFHSWVELVHPFTPCLHEHSPLPSPCATSFFCLILCPPLYSGQTGHPCPCRWLGEYT